MRHRISSDWHFWHKFILKYRPPDYESLIIKRHSNIPDEDILICLWDINFISPDKCLTRLNDLKCKKVLVLWNHDHSTRTSYHRYFDMVCDRMDLKYWGKDIILTHRPVFWLDSREINIHWHFHDIDLTHCMEEYPYSQYTKQHKLYSPELNKYEPVTMETLIYRDNKLLTSWRENYHKTNTFKNIY